jgi:hypothetical protein
MTLTSTYCSICFSLQHVSVQVTHLVEAHVGTKSLMLLRGTPCLSATASATALSAVIWPSTLTSHSRLRLLPRGT